MRLLPLFAVLLAGLVALPRGFAQSQSAGVPSPLPDLGDISMAAISPQMERRIGEEAMRQIRSRDPSYVDDPEVTEYLSTLGRKLTSASDGAGREFEFFLVKDDSINAFAMPGGFVGVHTGLLLAAQTESELASVLAHEISHVTQRHIARMVSRQSQISALSLAGALVALLAARSGSNAAQAALIASQAGAVQAQLGYSRDFEREADRTGFQILQQAGFELGGMASFFERLQKATRSDANNAPAYLRSHPLTGERIADIQNRVKDSANKQRVDSLEFHLVRAKLRAEQGTAKEALSSFESQLREKRYSSEAAARYGIVSALERGNDIKRAETELRRLRALTGPHPMVELLAARLRTAAGDLKGATDMVGTALSRYTNYRPLQHELVRLLQRQDRHQEALTLLAEMTRSYPRDSGLYTMQAQSYAATGRNLLRHRAQAEAYYLQGALPAAVEQLQLARRAGDGDYYELSTVEARLRELSANLKSELKPPR